MVARTYHTNEDKCVHHTYNTTGKKKVHLVHSLAPALTLNHLANRRLHTVRFVSSALY